MDALQLPLDTDIACDNGPMARPTFREVHRRAHYSGFEILQIVALGGFATVFGFVSLSHELEGQRQAPTLALIGLLLLMGGTSLASVVYDIATRPSPGPIVEHTPTWTIADSTHDQAVNLDLGGPTTAYPHFSEGHYYSRVLLPPLAWLAALLTIMYWADGSSGLATGAGIVLVAALGGVAYAWYASRRPTLRRWIVFNNGLLITDTNGNVDRIVRWDEVATWAEQGLTSESPMPYQLRLTVHNQAPLVLRGREISSVDLLRKEIMSHLRN